MPASFRRIPVLFFCLWLLGCSGPYTYEDAHYRVTYAGEMPGLVNEGSGLALTDDTTTVWTLNDGGGKTELYRISRTGRLRTILPLRGIRNVDWEALTRDTCGNLYIGDFGNNWSLRRDLCIYRVHPQRPDRIEKTTFRFSDQQAYPPLVNPRNFDCEAFFWYRDSLYLFSKNWSPAPEKLYVLPARPGNYTARLKEQTLLHPKAYQQGKRTLVTDAHISPDGKLLALLAYGEVFLFRIEGGEISLRHPYCHLQFDPDEVQQVESLVFLNATDFLFTNEQRDIFLARKK